MPYEGQALHGRNAVGHHTRGHGREPQNRGAGRLYSTLPSSFLFPLDSPNVCLTCLPSLSQALGTKSCLPPPYEDTSARAEQDPLTRLESEGFKAPLVREAAGAFPVCFDLPVLSVGLDVFVLPGKSVSWSD